MRQPWASQQQQRPTSPTTCARCSTSYLLCRHTSRRYPTSPCRPHLRPHLRGTTKVCPCLLTTELLQRQQQQPPRRQAAWKSAATNAALTSSSGARRAADIVVTANTALHAIIIIAIVSADRRTCKGRRVYVVFFSLSRLASELQRRGV